MPPIPSGSRRRALARLVLDLDIVVGLRPVITNEQQPNLLLVSTDSGQSEPEEESQRANGSVLRRHDTPPAVRPPHQPARTRSRRRPRTSGLLIGVFSSWRLRRTTYPAP